MASAAFRWLDCKHLSCVDMYSPGSTSNSSNNQHPLQHYQFFTGVM